MTESLTIENLLIDEAARLCRASPKKNQAKYPTASTSQYTQQSKEGYGPGHAIIRHWPPEKTHVAWGERNRTVLLEENIPLSIWSTLKEIEGLDNLQYHVILSSLSSIRSNDHGNEPAFRNICSKFLTRITAMASLFFLHQWSKHSNHKDYAAVLKTLQGIGDTQQEYTSEDSETAIIHDIASLIPRNSPIPLLKQLSGTSDGAVATMVNTKKTGNCEKDYQGFSSNFSKTPVANLDQVINICVQKTLSSPKALSIADLREFISAESKMAWPEKAISHLAQVRFL